MYFLLMDIQWFHHHLFKKGISFFPFWIALYILQKPVDSMSVHLLPGTSALCLGAILKGEITEK